MNEIFKPIFLLNFFLFLFFPFLEGISVFFYYFLV